MALQAAVIKRIEEDGVPAGAAPFRIMQDIEYYNRHGGMNKQLNDTITKIQMTNLISACNDAINTFMKLRLSGMTEDQILKMCRVIETNGHNLNSHYAKSINPQFDF